MASTGEAANVDSTGEVDTEALARDAGGGDGPSSSTKGAVRVVDKATQTVSTVDKAVQTDPLVEDTGECLRTRLLVIICWLVGMGVVLWTQMEWISKEMSTGSNQDSFLVISLLLLFSIGVIMFLQEAFESLTLLKAFRKAVEGRDSWDAILLLKDTILVPVWALTASNLWSFMWKNVVCKSSSDDICRWNVVGNYAADLMNATCVTDKEGLSVGTCNRVVAFAPLAVISFAAFSFGLTLSDAVARIQKKATPPQEPELAVTGGHQEEANNQTIMKRLSILEAISYVFCIGTNLSLLLMFDPSRRHELWRWLTVSLVHASSDHLWGNLFYQLLATRLLQVVHSSSNRSVGGIYVCGILGGSLACSLLSPRVPVVGASAGGCALIGAFSAKCGLRDARKLPPPPKLRATHFHSLLGPHLFVFFTASPAVLFLLFTFRLQRVFSPGNISHEGHFGGTLVGLFGALIVSLKDTPRESAKKKCLQVYAGILVVGVIAVNIFLPGNYPPTEWNFNYNRQPSV